MKNKAKFFIEPEEMSLAQLIDFLHQNYEDVEIETIQISEEPYYIDVLFSKEKEKKYLVVVNESKELVGRMV